MNMERVLKLSFSYLLLGIGLLGICCCEAFFNVQRHSASAHPLANPSFVRVIHASPYVGTADVFVDGSKLLSSFGFGAVTGYATVPAGPHKVQIALVGKGIGASVISETLTVSRSLSFVVAGGYRIAALDRWWRILAPCHIETHVTRYNGSVSYVPGKPVTPGAAAGVSISNSLWVRGGIVAERLLEW